MNALSGLPVCRRTALGALAVAGLGAGAQPADAQSIGVSAAGHVVLLGDSVFDNKAYVTGRPDVVTQLRQRLPSAWRATLRAVDGAVTSDIRRQLARVPADATHLVISVGGNNALHQEDVLGYRARTVGQALVRLAGVRERFGEDYRAMLDVLLGRGLPAAVCTIYDPRFPDPRRQQRAIAGLALFNDIIARAAFTHGLPLIDLRLVCDESADFANPIEPSAEGGGKIAATTAEWAAGQGRP